jgi:DNA polymerase I-like protein with 3'-5' exonuclease and polymerase domains
MLDLDPHTGELGYDYDQQERRIVAAISQDEAMLDTLARGWDAHTLDTCDVFGYPYPPDPTDPHTAGANTPWREAISWKGKKDRRRVMGKNFFFSLCYGKLPKNMMEIPGARALGMSPKRFEDAANRFLAKHPGIRRWMQGVRTRIKVRPMSRTFLGTRRYSHLRDNELYRAMLDHPIQAAAADMVNLVIVETATELDGLMDLRWTKHDFVSWNIRHFRGRLAQAAVARAIAIAEQEWEADGVRFRVPVSAYTRLYGGEKCPLLRSF